MNKLLFEPFCIISLIGMVAACGKSQEDSFIKNSQLLKTDVVSTEQGAVEKSGISIDMFAEEPKLSVDRVGSYVGDKITINTNHFSIDANDILGETSNWQILDEAEAIIVEESGGVQFEWTPDTAGTYTVKHMVTTAEVEVIATETLYVLNEMDRETDLIDRFWNLDEKLTGTWTGEIVSHYGNSAHVDMIFYNDGSYVLSRISQDEIYPRFPMEPPFMPGPMPFPPMPHRDMMFMEPYSPTSVLSFNKEKGSYELLDIWANGEVVGNMQTKMYPPTRAENMTRIRFNDDYSMVFFELSFDPFFMGDTETFVLSRVSDTAEPPSLEIISEQIVGNWKGNVITPWTMPYEVSFQFADDGTYMANSLTESMLHDGEKLGIVSPFYFGAVEPITEEIRYSIDEFIDGAASGDIVVELKTGELVSGTISDLEMSIDYSILVFTFNHYGKYGPMRYVLERQ